MGGAFSTCGGEKDIFNILVGRTEEQRSHRRRRCRWEDNIKTDLQMNRTGRKT